MLVVIGIIAILAALLFPAVSGMAERGKITQDMNNLRQIGLATQMYLNDNDGTYFLPSDELDAKAASEVSRQLEDFPVAV